MEMKLMLRKVMAHGLGLVRRGQPVVLWPREFLGFGNLLYLWLQAYKLQSSGIDARMLETDKAKPWRAEFPELFADLTIRREDVKFRYARKLGWYQEIGVDYGVEDLVRFARDYMLSARGIRRFEGMAAELGTQSITVNVRRGDYYTVSEFQAQYGFDIRGFVLDAVQQELQHDPAHRLFVISDDTAWCEEKLGPDLSRLGLKVDFAQGVDPARDFALQALSDRLILSNSTFSYWAGYLASIRSSRVRVTAPAFHARTWNEGRSFHLHPDWKVIEGFDGVTDSQ